MRVLLTGAAGYTGTGLADVLKQTHDVRGLDVKPNADLADMQVADIADLAVCRRAVEGIDAVVFCHMAPNPTGYETPELAIDVNVKGTANVYHAMAEHGIRRAVLVSTNGIRLGEDEQWLDSQPGNGPYGWHGGYYGLTKIFQEGLARHYHAKHGIVTTLLRPGWIVYDGTVTTKYGAKLEQYFSSLVDPRDLGHAVVRALAMDTRGLECFTLGQDDWDAVDVERNTDRLGWRPQYRFESLPRPTESQPQ